jgi:CRISPR system Cascade subunit CasC
LLELHILQSFPVATLPRYVLGIVKAKGQPIQLVNAFEKPMWAGKDATIPERAIAALKKEHQDLKTAWDISTLEEVSIPDQTINELINRLIAHVC